MAVLTLASPAKPIEVSPITVELPAGQKTATLTLTNRDKQKATIQIRIFAWDQDGTDDHLKATRDMAISPPFVTLPAGETQVVRIVLRKSVDNKELSYRILIDEIPPPDTPGNVKLMLRVSLPVFAEPKQRINAQVQWRAVRNNKGELELVGNNRGGKRARVYNMVVSSDGKPLQVKQNANPYILPGAERRWTLTGDTAQVRAGTVLRLTAASDDGPINARPAFASP